jgi:hypothetical protein
MPEQSNLAGATCRVARSGNLTITHRTRAPLYLLLSALGLLGAWLNVRAVGLSIAVLFLVLADIELVQWANSPRLRLFASARKLEWRQGSHLVRCPFDQVASVGVSVHQETSSSRKHALFDSNSTLKEGHRLHAQLELILKDGKHLPLGRVSGADAELQILSLTKPLAQALQVPAASAG